MVLNSDLQSFREWESREGKKRWSTEACLYFCRVFSLPFLPLSFLLFFGSQFLSYSSLCLSAYSWLLLFLLYYLILWDFSLLSLTGFLWASLQGFPLTYWLSQPLPLLRVCLLHHFPSPDKILFFFLPFISQYLPSLMDKDWRLSLYLSLWHASNGLSPLLASFGLYAIPVRHFPKRSLNRNPRIDPLFLPTTKPYPLNPLIKSPPLLYWLGRSMWCPNIYVSSTILRVCLLRLPRHSSRSCLVLFCYVYQVCAYLPWHEGCVGFWARIASLHFLMDWALFWAEVPATPTHQASIATVPFPIMPMGLLAAISSTLAHWIYYLLSWASPAYLLYQILHIQYQLAIIVCEILLITTQNKKEQISSIVSPKLNGDRCMRLFSLITIFQVQDLRIQNILINNNIKNMLISLEKKQQQKSKQFNFYGKLTKIKSNFDSN